MFDDEDDDVDSNDYKSVENAREIRNHSISSRCMSCTS